MSAEFSSSTRNFFAGIIGNIFEHYDYALFGLLAPFIAPLFFPLFSPLSALILTYGMMIVGIVSKPVGALFFGYIGDRYGRNRALFWTLMGMGIVTCFMGLLPTYEQVGGLAPVLLALCRFFQSFFAAGESTGGAILVLDRAPEKYKSFFSGLYDSSGIVGIFLASAVVTYFSLFEEGFTLFWRIPFFVGSLCGLCGIFLRRFSSEPVKMPSKVSIKAHFQEVYRYRASLLPIAFAAGFGYCTYYYSFSLMIGFLPFVSGISKQQACEINTYLLLFDLLLLPLMGLLAQKVVKERLMRWCALLLALLAIPLFSLLDGASSFTAVFVRVVIVTLGVGFSAPFHHWSLERVPEHLRYTLVGTAKAIGAQLIGLPCMAVSLWLFKKTDWVAAPALYLVVIASYAALAVSPVFSKKQSLVNR